MRLWQKERNSTRILPETEAWVVVLAKPLSHWELNSSNNGKVIQLLNRNCQVPPDLQIPNSTQGQGHQ